MPKYVLLSVAIAAVLYGALEGTSAPHQDAQNGPERVAEARQPFGFVFAGEVTRVIDGDTVEVVPTMGPIHVRLLDCWAPESRTTDLVEKRLGLASKANLTRLAAGQTVKVFVPTAPGGGLGASLTFGRPLGHVYLQDGTSLAEEQVRTGHATITKPKLND